MTTEQSDRLPFVDRRKNRNDQSYQGVERRQFSNSHSELSDGAKELGLAIDQYKLHNRRRYITYEEMYNIMIGLGYAKQGTASPQSI